MSFTLRFNHLKKKLSTFPNWEEKIRYLIQLSNEKDRPPPDDIRNEKNRIKACSQGLWLLVETDEDQEGPVCVNTFIDSESKIIHALGGVFSDVISGLPLTEIKENKKTLASFYLDLNLLEQTGRNRQNALLALVATFIDKIDDCIK